MPAPGSPITTIFNRYSFGSTETEGLMSSDDVAAEFPSFCVEDEFSSVSVRSKDDEREFGLFDIYEI